MPIKFQTIKNRVNKSVADINDEEIMKIINEGIGYFASEIAMTLLLNPEDTTLEKDLNAYKILKITEV